MTIRVKKAPYHVIVKPESESLAKVVYDYLVGASLVVDPLPSERTWIFYHSDRDAFRSDFEAISGDLRAVWTGTCAEVANRLTDLSEAEDNDYVRGEKEKSDNAKSETKTLAGQREGRP